MREVSVTADSKGVIGALSLLLCISFEMHKNGASLGSGEGPSRLRRGFGGQATRPSTDARGSLGTRPAKASGMQRAQILGRIRAATDTHG
jgi:hypothetical protein